MIKKNKIIQKYKLDVVLDVVFIILRLLICLLIVNSYIL